MESPACSLLHGKLWEKSILHFLTPYHSLHLPQSTMHIESKLIEKVFQGFKKVTRHEYNLYSGSWDIHYLKNSVWYSLPNSIFSITPARNVWESSKRISAKLLCSYYYVSSMSARRDLGVWVLRYKKELVQHILLHEDM